MSESVIIRPNEDGNDPYFQVSGSSIMLPIDIQSRLSKTTQTHNAVSIPLSASSDSTYQDCNGYIQVGITLKNDAATSSTITLIWSNDGATDHGSESFTASTNALSAVSTQVKARYLKVRITNGDAAIAHTMSAWIYLTT